MDLKRNVWTEADGKEFHAYLKSLERPEKLDWTRRIINTNMPLLAIATPDIRKISKEIAKGNYLSFLDLALNDYYEDTAVNGSLISIIKDFDTVKKYLIPFAEKADNWATCDLVTFNVKPDNADKLWELAGEMLSSEKCFVRRIGVDIMFKFILPIGENDYLQGIFERIAALTNENEYYVNMCAAWLIAECFTKRRDDTLAFYVQNRMNTFITNKSVQKCRDSFRITQEDKDYLLRFKK